MTSPKVNLEAYTSDPGLIAVIRRHDGQPWPSAKRATILICATCLVLATPVAERMLNRLILTKQARIELNATPKSSEAIQSDPLPVVPEAMPLEPAKPVSLPAAPIAKVNSRKAATSSDATAHKSEIAPERTESVPQIQIDLETFRSMQRRI